MGENAFTVCAYYYSVPEFPSNCEIVNDNSLFVRDVLVSNRLNPHVELGGQYDPHYENTPLPEYKMCQPTARRWIASKIEEGGYDQVYLLFRTNKTRLSEASTQHIAGYYEIDEKKIMIDPEYGEPVLYAREARFTDLENAPSLSSFLDKYGNRRFAFSSETEGGKFEPLLTDWRRKVDSAPNLLPSYVETTRRLDRLFENNEFENGIYESCEGCACAEKCPLIRRIRVKGKLFHQLPRVIALKIRRHYRTS